MAKTIQLSTGNHTFPDETPPEVIYKALLKNIDPSLVTEQDRHIINALVVNRPKDEQQEIPKISLGEIYGNIPEKTQLESLVNAVSSSVPLNPLAVKKGLEQYGNVAEGGKVLLKRLLEKMPGSVSSSQNYEDITTETAAAIAGQRKTSGQEMYNAAMGTGDENGRKLNWWQDLASQLIFDPVGWGTGAALGALGAKGAPAVERGVTSLVPIGERNFVKYIEPLVGEVVSDAEKGVAQAYSKLPKLEENARMLLPEGFATKPVNVLAEELAKIPQQGIRGNIQLPETGGISPQQSIPKATARPIEINPPITRTGKIVTPEELITGKEELYPTVKSSGIPRLTAPAQDLSIPQNFGSGPRAIEEGYPAVESAPIDIPSAPKDQSSLMKMITDFNKRMGDRGSIPNPLGGESPTDATIDSLLKGEKPSLLKRMKVQGPYKPSPSGMFDSISTSIDTFLRKYSGAGASIADKINMAEKTGSRLYGQLSTSVSKSLAGLNETELANVTEVLDKGVPAYTPRIQKAADDIRKVLDIVAHHAGKNIDEFKKVENFFPHVFRKEFIEALGYNKNIDQLAIELAAKDTDGVMFGRDPARAMEYIKETMNGVKRRTRFSNLDFSRVKNMPGWVQDPKEALDIYLRGATKRIAEIEQFGRGDSTIESMLSHIAENYGPKEAGKVRQAFKVGIRDMSEIIGTSDLEAKVVPFEVFTKLGTAVLGNAGQTSNTMLRTGIFNTLAGMKDVIKNPALAKEYAQESGILLDNIVEEMTGATNYAGKLLERTGFNRVERWNRMVTVAAARRYVTQKAGQLITSGNLEGQAAKALNELGLDASKILKYGRVGEKDILDAAYEIGRETQFTKGAQHLPIEFTRSPTGRMLTLFKNFAFKQSKFLKDTFKRNPASMARLIPMTLVFGEILGDAKGALGLGQDRSKMGFTEREFDNFLNLSSAGILADMIRSAASGKLGATQFAAGPIIGTGAEIASDAYSAIAKQDIKPTIRSLLQRVPIGGRQLQKWVAPTKSQEMEWK